MNHVYILWYENRVDEPRLISLHWTMKGAEQAAIRWADEQGYGHWGSDLVVEHIEVYD